MNKNLKPKNTTEYSEILKEIVYSENETTVRKLYNKYYGKIHSMVLFYTNRCAKHKWYIARKEELEAYVDCRFWQYLKRMNKRYHTEGFDSNFDIALSAGFSLNGQTSDFYNTKYMQGSDYDCFTDICEYSSIDFVDEI